MLDDIKRYWRSFKRWVFGANPPDAELSAIVNDVVNPAKIEGFDQTKPRKPKKPGPHCCVIIFDDNGETWCSPTNDNGDDCATLKDRLERTYKRTASQNFFEGAHCPKRCERII